jgi:hypothetical protein
VKAAGEVKRVVLQGAQGKCEAADPMRYLITSDLVLGVSAMHVDCQSPKNSGTSRNSSGKEHVSFGTNMSSEEESEETSTGHGSGKVPGKEMVKNVPHRTGEKISRSTENKLALLELISSGLGQRDQVHLPMP